MKEIKLTQGKVALVDDADFEWLSKWKWFYHSTGYAMRNMKKSDNAGKRGVIYMHREVLRPAVGFWCDHISRNRLDNRRANLRSCLPVQSIYNRALSVQNSNGFRGVTKDRRRFAAIISIGNKRFRIGTYGTPEQAHRAYLSIAKAVRGEFYNQQTI